MPPITVDRKCQHPSKTRTCRNCETRHRDRDIVVVDSRRRTNRRSNPRQQRPRHQDKPIELGCGIFVLFFCGRLSRQQLWCRPGHGNDEGWRPSRTWRTLLPTAPTLLLLSSLAMKVKNNMYNGELDYDLSLVDDQYVVLSYCSRVLIISQPLNVVLEKRMLCRCYNRDSILLIVIERDQTKTTTCDRKGPNNLSSSYKAPHLNGCNYDRRRSAHN